MGHPARSRWLVRDQRPRRTLPTSPPTAEASRPLNPTAARLPTVAADFIEISFRAAPRSGLRIEPRVHKCQHPHRDLAIGRFCSAPRGCAPVPSQVSQLHNLDDRFVDFPFAGNPDG